MQESNLSNDCDTAGLTRIDVQLKAVLREHTGGVTSVRFSFDGMILASIASDEICVWEREGWRLRCTIPGARSERISISPDGKFIAAAAEQGTVRLWTVDGTVVGELYGHDSEAPDATFSPSGRILVTGDGIGNVYLWDVQTQRLLRSFLGTPHGREGLPKYLTREASSFAFSPDGTRLAMTCCDSRGSIQLWHIDEQDMNVEWIETLGTPRRITWPPTFSPDGKLLVISSVSRGEVYFYDTDSFLLQHTLLIPDEIAKSISFSPTDRYMAIGGAAGTIWLWDMLTQHMICSFQAHTDGCDYRKESQLWALGEIDWSRSGEFIATGGTSPGTFYDPKRQRYLGPDDYTVKVWQVLMNDETEKNKEDAGNDL